MSMSHWQLILFYAPVKCRYITPKSFMAHAPTLSQHRRIGYVPQADMDTEGMKNRKLANDNWANILYQGAEKKRAY